MAGIVEAFDSTMKEALAGFKIFLWAFPITLILTAPGESKIYIGAIVSFFVLGFMVTLANNVISKAPMIVPGINFVKIIINAILACIAILPYSAIAALIIWGYSFVHIPSDVWDLTFRIVVGLFAAAFPLTAICILVRRMNPLEVLNVKKVMFGLGEVFLSYTMFSIRVILCLSLLLSFIIYIFKLFIGFENVFWWYLVSVNIMTFICLLSNAIAQISDDVYTFPEQEEAKKREREAIDALTKQEQANSQK